MRKYIITITEILDEDPRSTAVVNISDGTIAVGCPKSSGIEVESFTRASGFELIFNLGRTDQRLHFICANCHTNHTDDAVDLVETYAVSNEFQALDESNYSLQ